MECEPFHVWNVLCNKFFFPICNRLVLLMRIHSNAASCCSFLFFYSLGASNRVIWNGVHHKTNVSGGCANFGYPDPGYFGRCVSFSCFFVFVGLPSAFVFRRLAMDVVVAVCVLLLSPSLLVMMMFFFCCRRVGFVHISGV